MIRTPSLRLLTLAAAFSLAAPLAAEGPPAKRPFTLPDFYRVVTVGEPALSPDGRSVVYTVTAGDVKTGKRTTALWTVGTDGAGARRLTWSEARDTQPTFTPDGKTLAFLSTRSGDPQLFLLPLAGGEAEKKTDFPGGISDPSFSADGTKVLFAADVDPACGADAACNKASAEARETSKLKAWVEDALLYRHWNSWREGRRTHLFLLDLATGALTDLTPGDVDGPVFSVGGSRDFDLSPDGKELAFASNRTKEPAENTNADLFVVRLDGGAEALKAPRNLTARNAGWDGTPRYSPDGKWLAFRRQVTPKFEADRFRIVLIDRSTGVERDLTAGLDDTVGDLAWSADSKRIFFTADVKGRTPLHELEVATGKIRVLTGVGTLDAFRVARDASFAVVARRRIGQPTELWRIDVSPKPNPAGTRLTTHNAALEAEVDIRPAEERFFPGADGKPVQTWIVTPHGFDPAKKYPLILNIHGGPQQQWSDSFRGDWQVYPGAGYVVAFPNPHGSTGFGQAYTSAISGDWDGKVMEDVAKVTDELAKLPYVDPQRIGVMGWSWGGYAVMWLVGHTDRYKAAASMMGVYDLRSMHGATEELWFPEWDLKGAPWENPDGYRKQSPSSYARNFRTPTLVLTGQRDFRVPYAQSLMFFTDLQKMEVPSRLVVWEKAGHWPSWQEMALYYAAHLDWFHRFLGGDPSPWDPRAMAAGKVWDAADGKK
ncbi:MAG TPA: S9 family peptidase [Thermoanaerobaculia bacterium]|nr:S9 family peptidase [Thermoanaerobaculia bacterium]